MEQRNMIIAFVLSMLILLGWGMLFPQQETDQGTAVKQSIDQPPAEVAKSVAKAAAKPQQAASSDTTPPAAVAAADVPATDGAKTDGAKQPEQRPTFSIHNDKMRLTVNDKGWLVGALLNDYRVSIDPDAKHVEALHLGEGRSVYVTAGVMQATLKEPFHVVQRSANAITMQATLSNGRVWQRTLRLRDGSYQVAIDDRIIGGAGLKFYQQVVERNPDKKKNTFYEHMGPTGLVNGKLVEPDYDDLDEGAQTMASVGGWTAVMNRYFIAAMIPDPKQSHTFYYKGNGSAYQAGLIDTGEQAGADAHFHINLYVGPKSIPILKQAGAGLERAVDFGFVTIIAKPMHQFLGWLYQYVGNYGWCIIILVITIKIIFFYPTQKSYTSMAAMRKLQPELTLLKERYGDDRQQMGQEVMKLYKKHKVNPMGGCLPILIQMPVFFALYRVLLVSIEMRQAPFIGWIQDMSVQDPYFVLPVIMGASMFIQQRLNPAPPDPMQAKVMQFLPIIFTVMFLFFPAGLVLYWVVNNVLSILQQWMILKRMNVQ